MRRPIHLDAVQAYFREHEPSHTAFWHIDGVLRALNRFSFTTGLVVGLNTDCATKRCCIRLGSNSISWFWVYDMDSSPGHANILPKDKEGYLDRVSLLATHPVRTVDLIDCMDSTLPYIGTLALAAPNP